MQTIPGTSLYVPMNSHKTLEVLPDSQKKTNSSEEAVRYVVMHGISDVIVK